MLLPNKKTKMFTFLSIDVDNPEIMGASETYKKHQNLF